MFEEMINRYVEFSDSLISKVIKNNEIIVLYFTTCNLLNKFKYEEIELTFKDVLEFKHNPKDIEDVISVKDVFISNKNNVIRAGEKPIKVSKK